MNKTIPVLIIGVVIGLIAGCFITTRFLTPKSILKGYVQVSVKNRSGQEIKSLTLKHESGSLEMKSLPKAESANLIFKNVGENSYRIVATLANGLTLSSRENYVEAGYRTRELILPDTIKTTTDIY